MELKMSSASSSWWRVLGKFYGLNIPSWPILGIKWKMIRCKDQTSFPTRVCTSWTRICNSPIPLNMSRSYVSYLPMLNLIAEIGSAIFPSHHLNRIWYPSHLIRNVSEENSFGFCFVSLKLVSCVFLRMVYDKCLYTILCFSTDGI